MALLPGQQIINGVSNLIFGTNTPNYDTTLLTNTAVQAQMAAAGITVIRTALNSSSGPDYTDAQLDQLYTAIHACGAVMLAIIPHNQLAFSQHVVSYLGSRCMLYEYSNERDINGESWQTYLSEWNTIIPALRAINPGAAFIGPVLGAFSNVSSYLVPWLQGCVTSGVLPDAISVHIYPCTTTARIPQATCALKAPTIGASVASLRTTIQNIVGHSLPLCLTEWNADAWYANPTTGNQPGQGYNTNSTTNDSFNHQFAIDTLDGLVANQIDMACHFELDYFLANKTGSTSTAAQYTAIEAEVVKYLSSGGTGGSSNLGILPTSLSFTAALGGASTSIQTVTLNNTGSASGTLSSTLSYSAYSTLNWIALSSSSSTIAASGTLIASLSCIPQVGMPVGTYSATITFTMGTSTATLTILFTITPAQSGTTDPTSGSTGASSATNPISVSGGITVSTGPGVGGRGTSGSSITVSTENTGSVSSPFLIYPPLDPTNPAKGRFGIGVYRSILGGTTYNAGFPSASLSSFQLSNPYSGIFGGQYGYVLDTTIRPPETLTYTPAQEVGLDTAGFSIVRGYPQMVWTYGTLRPDYWYYLQNLFTLSARTLSGFEHLVLLQYPANDGTLNRVQTLARWDPPVHSARDVGAYYDITLTFNYLGLVQLNSQVLIQVLS